MDKIEYGYCFCGCEFKTKISQHNDKRYGHIKGEPRRFLQGHYLKLKPTCGKDNPMYDRKGKDCPNWRG